MSVLLPSRERNRPHPSNRCQSLIPVTVILTFQVHKFCNHSKAQNDIQHASFWFNPTSRQKLSILLFFKCTNQLFFFLNDHSPYISTRLRSPCPLLSVFRSASPISRQEGWKLQGRWEGDVLPSLALKKEGSYLPVQMSLEEQVLKDPQEQLCSSSTFPWKETGVGQEGKEGKGGEQRPAAILFRVGRTYLSQRIKRTHIPPCSAGVQFL